MMAHADCAAAPLQSGIAVDAADVHAPGKPVRRSASFAPRGPADLISRSKGETRIREPPPRPACPSRMILRARHFRLLALVGLLLATLTGCMSMVGFGYNHADTVAAWKADEYFDLDGDQKQAFRARFERLYRWHRHEALPEYVAFLSAARQRLQRGLDSSDVEWFADGLEARYRTLAGRAAPDAADLLATLTPEQIETLQRHWDKDNRKFADEHKLEGTPEERRRARVKRTISQIKNWVGGLTDEQEDRIAELARALPDTGQMRHVDRIRRQREFVALLGERQGDRKAFAARLTHWLQHWEEGRSPEYRRLSDAAWTQRVRLYVTVQHMLTPEQRATASQRLQNHIRELRRLLRRD